MKDYRTTRVPNFFEFIRVACPICGHTGGCMINSKGDRVVCIRVESEKSFSKNSALPSWLHFLNEKQPAIKMEFVEKMAGNKKLSDNRLVEVYSSMLDFLELTDEHYRHLISPSRGLKDEQIMIRGYTSFPNAPWTLVRAIQNDLGIESFAGVPGFFEARGKNGGSYWSMSGREGILIPYRNSKNQITGFQYRIDNPPPIAKVKQMSGVYGLKARNEGNKVIVSHEGKTVFEKEMKLDENVSIENNGKTLGFVSLKKGGRYFWLSSANKKNGTGAGSPSPVHISVPSKILKHWERGKKLKKRKVWLTEGALKADIASDMLHHNLNQEQLSLYGDTFMAIPGVNAWQTILPVLKEIEVEEINLAFDRDFSSNRYVMKSLKEFMAYAKEKGYHVNMVAWGKGDGKGIDDLLLKGKLPTITPIF